MSLTSIIIPVFAPGHLAESKVSRFLLPQLEAFFNLTTQPLELVYHVNPSHPSVLKVLANWQAHGQMNAESKIQIRILQSPEPIGFVRAINQGLLAASGDILVLWNDDSILLPSPVDAWLTWLTEPFKDPKVGLTGIHVNQGPGGPFLLGYCLVVRRTVFETVGLLDESLSPGGYDDADFMYRAQSVGWRFEQIDKSTKIEGDKVIGWFPIYHEAGSSFHHLTHVNDFSSTGTWATAFANNEAEVTRRVKRNYYSLELWRESRTIIKIPVKMGSVFKP